MATTIITKHGTGVPSSLQVGELAIDKSEPAIYTNTGSGVQKIATASSGGGLLEIAVQPASAGDFSLTVPGGDLAGQLNGPRWTASGTNVRLTVPNGMFFLLTNIFNGSNVIDLRHITFDGVKPWQNISRSLSQNHALFADAASIPIYQSVHFDTSSYYLPRLYGYFYNL